MGEERTTTPRVITFGPAECRMFGMHHPPPAGTPARNMGVVLCPPLGWEMIASFRSHRALADLLSARGFHVLRFDYPGTGDSSGDEMDPGRVRAWVEGIGHAVEELKRRSSIAEVALIGVRVGAMLAALYSSDPDLPAPAAIALWSPFLTGRSLLREVRAYQALNEQKNVGLITTEGDTAGFVLTPETRQALGEVDLLQRRGYRGRAALVLARDEHSNESKLSDLLQSSGMRSEFERIPGILPMLQEPRKSVIPHDVFARIVRWLEEVAPSEGVNAEAPPADTSPALMAFDGYREEATFFGRDDALFGIATVPNAKAKQTGVLWLNTANDHRVGPNRSYVPLARALAKLGYASFRFDPRDVGDGASATGSHAYSMDRHVDVERAMGFFHDHYGIKQLVLVGLCSGAYMAFHFGTKDPRVVGEVIVNPQTFDWKEGDSFDLITRTYRSVRAYKGLLSNPRTWRRALKGQIRVGAIALSVGRQLAARGKNWLDGYLPAKPGQPLNIKRTVRSKLHRGLKVLFVLAENDGAMDFVEQHLGHRARSFSSHPGFRFEAVPGVDHTFSQRWAKDQLSALVVSHLTKYFP